MPCIPQGGGHPFTTWSPQSRHPSCGWKVDGSGVAGLCVSSAAFPWAPAARCFHLHSFPCPLSLVLRFTHPLMSQCTDLSDVCVEQGICCGNTVVRLTVTSPGEICKPSRTVLWLILLSAKALTWAFGLHCAETLMRDTFGQKNLESIHSSWVAAAYSAYASIHLLWQNHQEEYLA